MWPALLVAGAAALIDWAAVRKNIERVESIAKPVVMAALAIGVAVEGDSAVDWLIVAALMLSLLGDLLLLPAIDNFLGGLSSFFAAHLAYIAAFATIGVDAGLLVVGAVVALVGTAALGRPIVQSSTLIDDRLGRAVLAYIVVLSVMLAFGISTAEPLLIAGAVIFAASDGVLGWNRFVEPVGEARLLTHVLYHVGQGLIAAWAIAG